MSEEDNFAAKANDIFQELLDFFHKNDIQPTKKHKRQSVFEPHSSFLVPDKPDDYLISLTEVEDNVKNRAYDSQVWNFIFDVTFALKLIRDNYGPRTMMYKKSLDFQDKLDETMDEFMKRNDFCCGRIFIRDAKDVGCSAKQGCKVKDGQNFYRYNEFTFCGEHFEKFENQKLIKVSDELKIRTTAFKKYIYVEEKLEEMVVCSGCDKRFHERCVHFLNDLFAEFRCKKCRNKYDIRFDTIKANSLPKTKFDIFVTKYLLDRFNPEIPLQIRLLSSMNKVFKVKRVIDNYRSSLPEIGYRNSTLFAFFEDTDGYDICFFSVFLQLYDNEAPEPNKNSAYVSYIDSVKLLIDTEKRTKIYQLILLGIFEFLKTKGYEKIFIWSCAPGKNVDYIFPRKPEDQQIPTSQHLSEWYKSLIDRGKELDVIESSEGSENFSYESNWEDINNIPIMDGDLWSTRLAEAILTAEKEALKFDSDQMKDACLAGYFDKKERIWELLQVQTKGFDHSYFVLKMKNVPKTNDTMEVETIERNWVNNRHLLFDFFSHLKLEFGSPRQARFATYVLLHRIITESSICRHCYRNTRLGPYLLCNQCAFVSAHPLLIRVEKLRLDVEKYDFVFDGAFVMDEAACGGEKQIHNNPVPAIDSQSDDDVVMIDSDD